MNHAAVILIALCGFGALAADCNAPPADARATIDLPGAPFKLAVSRDGCRIFVSLLKQSGAQINGVAMLRRADGKLELERTVKVGKAPVTGLALTHDEKTLIATDGSGAMLLDMERLISGEGDPVVGHLAGPSGIYANTTTDDKIAFVSNEESKSITVYDLDKRSAIGTIPVGVAPIALTFSKDEKWLYTTSQAAPPDWEWPAVCASENPRDSVHKHPLGAIAVVDVAKARVDPEHAVVAKVKAGCNPVRLALSPNGDRAYVTARKDNALLVFDTAKLACDNDGSSAAVAGCSGLSATPAKAPPAVQSSSRPPEVPTREGADVKLAEIQVGTAPVPLVALKDGARVVVGNSNRFGNDGGAAQSLSVVDAVRGMLVGSIEAGAFPRDLVLSPDGKTLFLANFGSATVEMFDVARLPVKAQ